MDRRATLTAILGKSSRQKEKNGIAKAPVITSGLEPYSGVWEFEQAAHLLRRTTFGPNYQQIKNAVSEGMGATVAKLLEARPQPAPPVNSDYANDPYVPIGETWVNKGYESRDQTNIQAIYQYRRRSLRSWLMEQVLTEGVHIREKMTLFWHNHFVTADINEPLYEWQYIRTLRENAMGNFRELSKKITIDPAMLLYLNGNQNSVQAPNENYARELLELFTIGKGPLAGPGDYTNYTEDDIREAARILTGWILNFRGTLGETIDLDNLSQFVEQSHDRNSKQLSHRFGNAVISNQGADEYKALVDVIFQQEECARHICRKLYRWFIYYVITPEAEVNVIEPMVQLMIIHDYELKPVLETLFKSQHFYDMLNIGPMIKNPLDFVFSVLRATYYENQLSSNLSEKYAFLYFMSRTLKLEEMQMVYLNPPDVAGWKAYYQEPSYYRIWINSATLTARKAFTEVALYATDDRGRPLPYRIDVLNFVANIDNSLDPNSVIDEFSKILFPQPITAEQKTYLKEILLPGLPDYEWTIEYGQYLSNPDDSDLKESVETKLRALLHTMLNMPEFYLS